MTSHDDYTVAWICALSLELAAAKAMLDETHPRLPQPETDHNVYTLGRSSSHNVVVVSLPSGVYGTISATAVVSHLVSTFRSVRFGLMVGIGGGVPSSSVDIRLGDVVISKPTAISPGVIQYDYGKTLPDGRFQRIGSLNKPPPVLLKAVSQLESDYMTGKRRVSNILDDVLHGGEFHKDGRKRTTECEELRKQCSRQKDDWLFQPTYNHENSEYNCSACDQTQLVMRPKRITDDPHIHYGLIASGDQVMKDAKTRDSIAQDLGILCFEMEAAGIMDELPSLVIRGICDYCDSHKNKQWQGYAALAAAAYAKALLSVVPSYRYEKELHASKEPVWMVPLRKNSQFIGREEEIVIIERLIMQQDGPGKVAICGLGGVGKTQIALELAYRMRSRDPECSIFWIICTSYENVEQAYMNIASKLGMTDVKPAEVKEKVKNYLSQKSAGKWLLLFDNADDMDIWGKENNSDSVLTDFLPQSEQGHVLFTTRNRKLAVKLVSHHVITITEPNEETAVKILQSSLVDKALLDDHNTVITLLQQLDFLPLAITQAAAYINENSIRLSDYIALLQDQEPDVIELLSEDFEDERRYKDAQNPVASTWFISFQQIQQSNTLAAEYLSFMACINPRDIPKSLLPQAPSTKKTVDAIGLLKAFSFISEDGGDCFLNLHRLVHLATRNWLRKSQQFGLQILKTADRLNESFANNDDSNRQVWRGYLPHAFSLVTETDFHKEQERYITLIENIWKCLYSDGRWREAEEIGVQAMELHQKVLGPEHPGTLLSLSNLVLTYMDQGRQKKAEELGIQVIELRKKVLGPEHPDTLNSINNLASTYTRQGRWNEAEELEMQVIELRKEILGLNHPDTLTSMNNLASIYANQGRWKKAEELDIQVIGLRKQVLGPKHLHTLTTMSNLALTYIKQGRWNEAEELEIQVIELRKEILGLKHPYTLNCMGNLALTYANQGRWKKAEELDIQVIGIRKQVLGLNHPDTLATMNNLAVTYMNQSRWKEAEELVIQLIQLQKHTLGPEHPNALISMGNLASIYLNQGQQKEAEELEIQVLELRKQLLGPNHPDTLDSMSTLAYAWKSLGKVQDALTLLEKCVELRRNVLGQDHPFTISCSNALRDWQMAVDSSLKNLKQQTPASSVLPTHNHSPKQMKSGSEAITGGKRRTLLSFFRSR